MDATRRGQVGERGGVALSRLLAELARLFRLEAAPVDETMARVVPALYDDLGVDWRSLFDPAFAERFDGLLLRGAEHVGTVHCAVFPSPDVLARFLASAAEGDLLFLHHPVDMESGDPRGRPGRAFLPIDPAAVAALRARRLSVYSCHGPMDVHPEIGTTAAIVAAMGWAVEDRFLGTAAGPVGAICAVPATGTEALVAELVRTFRIPYADVEGPARDRITRVAVVAGTGDNVEWFREAEGKGAQAYVTGEIHCHTANAYGRMRFAQVMAYVPETTMSLVGVSHAASEFLVMPTQMVPWFRSALGVRAVAIPPDAWWR